MTEKKRAKDVVDLEGLDEMLENTDSLDDVLSQAIEDADKIIDKGKSAESSDSGEDGESVDEDLASAINDALGALGGSSEKKVEQAKPTTSKPTGLVEADEQEDESEKAQEYYDRLLRVTANFENFKRRAAKDKEELARYATGDLILQLLPVVDNFERALMQSTSGEGDKVLEGVRMIYRQMLDVLYKNGVRSVDSIGKRFDPIKHQAVEMREHAGSEPETVIEECQKGYFLRDRLLRPALVVVSKTPVSAPVKTEEEAEGSYEAVEEVEILEEAEIMDEGQELEDIDEIEEVFDVVDEEEDK